MKKEASKKSMKWIWLVIGIVVLVAALAVGAFLLFGQGEDSPAGPVGGKAEIYWNVDRLTYTENSVTGLSTREPEEDGLYHITFAIDGSQVELTVADKKLVNSIDAMDAMGLVFGDDGTVVDVVPADTLATLGANNMYVKTYENGVLTVNSSIALNGMELQFTTGDLTGIYNCSRTAEMVGEISELMGMDRVQVYQNDLGEPTHVFITDRAPETDVYWRMEQFYDSTNVVTTRVPDENGVYTIRFTVKGDQVDLKCKDQALVTEIDKMNTYNCATGLVFDEEGYIVELISAGLAVRGTAEATQFTVTEITETTFMTTRIIPGNNQGSEHGGGLTPETKVYNVNTSGEVFGEETDLRLGDTVFCLIGSDGNAKIIYVVNRMVEGSLYYNLSRSYDSTTRETTREMVNGRYEFELAANGTTITVWTRDKAIASKMDSYTRYCFGLKLSDNNEVLKVYDPENITGWTSSPNNLFVSSLTGRIAAFVSSVSDFTLTAPLAEGCRIYDISDMAENVGEPTELRVNDRCQGYRNINGEIVVIFVTARQVDGYIAWNTSRKYSDTTLETTREPDENGYYVYDVIIDGKERTVKTSSKTLATKIDEKKPGAVGLQLSGNIVTGVYEAHNIVGGTKVASTFYVKEFTETGFVADYVSVTGNGYWKSNVTWADEYVVYNVSRNFNDHRGERTTLKIGDRIHCIRDKAAKTIIVFVYEREVDCEPYMKLDRFYDKEKGETTRQPDENGWYNFQIIHKGEVKTYRTKDKEIASSVDYYSYFFALVADGDIILRALPVDYVKGVTGTLAENYDIMSINSSLTKATMYKHYPGDTDVGTETELTFDSNCKFIDFCVYSETFGQEVIPQVGDRVYSLRGEGGRVLYACITKRVTHEGGYQSVCPHCDKEVWWEPWSSGPIISQDLHYYLATDVDLEAQLTVGNLSKDFEVVFDLNGKTLTSEARGIYIYRNDKMVIIDTSKAQTGKIVAKGAANGTGGGVIQVAEGAEMTIMGGTYMMAPEHNAIQHGGIVYVTEGKMNVLGGTFIGGESDNYGGIIYVRDGDFSAKNATFSDGVTSGKGGIFYMDAKSRPVTFENCVLENGSAADGGNVYVIGEVTFTDCTIKGGEAKTGNGGNIAIYDSSTSGGKVTLAGKTTVTGGKSAKIGGNIFISRDSSRANKTYLTIKDQTKISGGTATTGGNLGAGNAVVSISILGGTIEGDVNIREVTELTLAGKTVITKGSEYGLNLAEYTKVDATGLKAGSKIVVNGIGVFTTNFADAAAAEAAKAYFISGDATKPITLVGKALSCGEGTVASEDPAPTAPCPEHGEVTWEPWTGGRFPESGHYYVAADEVKMNSSHVSIGSESTANAPIHVCLNLNGKNITSATKVFLVQENSTLELMDTSSQPGTVTGTGVGASSGVVQVYNGGNLVIHGGIYKVDESTGKVASGGIVYASGSAGKIGSLTVKGGEFYGANITGNGGIFAANNYGAITIEGGSFHQGNATIGNNIAVYGNSSSLELKNVTFPGDIQVTKGEGVKLTGKVVVTKGTAGGLILADGIKVDATGLTAESQINVDAIGVFTTDFANAAAAEAAKGYFTPKSNKDIAVQGNALAVVGAAADPAPSEPCPEHGAVTWTPWSGEKFQEGGHYYVSTEVELSGHVTIGSTPDNAIHVCLNLNGNNITSAKKVFLVQEGSTLELMDTSSQPGTVTGTSAGTHSGVVQVYNGGNLVVHSGIYRLNETANKVTSGGIVYASGSAGKIGSLTVKGGEFYGADITGNGGIFAANNYGAITIEGGSFHQGSAAIGNNVAVYGNSSSLELKNVTFPGDIEVTKGEGVKLTGKVVVTQGTAGGLILADGVKVDATGLAAESQILVDANGVFTTDFANAAAAEAAKAHFSVPSGKAMEVQGNALAVTGSSTEPDPDPDPDPDQPPAGSVDCPHCDANITWVEWHNGDATPASGHYVLADDVVTVSARKMLNSGNTLVIDLNGKTLEMASTLNTTMFYVGDGAKLVMMDSSNGNGQVIGNQQDSDPSKGRGIIQAFSGNVDIYGGIYRLNDDSEAGSGGIFRVSRDGTKAVSVINIYGGEFYGAENATGDGGIVYMTVGNLNIQGGTFHAGNVDGNGDTIYVGNANAELTIGGTAVIESGIYVANAKSIALKSGVVIDATALTAATPVELDAEGVFTTDFADATAAEAAKALFAAPTGKEITVQGSALAVVAGSTEPEPEPDPDPEQPPVGETCEHCGQVVTWTEWHNGDTTPASGHYVLAENVTMSATKTLNNGNELVIDLAGNKLELASGKNKMFTVNDGAKIVFMDSSAAGTGEVIGYQNGSNAGVAQVYGGSMDIYGGTFRLRDGASALNGGLFRITSNTKTPVVNIKGGTFYGSAATNGGIISMTYATLNISGGTFYPGSASEVGDAFQVNSAKANVSISGDAVIYGGIEITDAESITISGNPTILKAAENGSAYSIKLAAGKFITLGELEATAKIGLTGSGTVVKGYPTAPDAIFGAKNFVADEATKFIAAKGETLVLSEKPTATTFDCPHCDETVTWQVWDGTAKPATAGHYYLNGNVAPRGNFTLADYGTVVLNLNGYAVYKENSGNVFLAQGATELVFMDSSANQTGTVVANNNSTKDGVIANAYQAGSSVTIYGGNYLSGTPDVSARNGGLLYANGGTVTIEGGEFWGTTAVKGGVVTAKAGTLEINGGVFHPGTASTAGDTICVEGTADVTIGGDAIIEGGVAISAGSVTLTGTPVIQRNPHSTATDYSLKTAVPVTVGTLAKGAKIAVNQYNDTVKVFAAFDNADAAKAAATYFYSDDPANAIVLDGTALGLEVRAEGVADLKDPANDKTLNVFMMGNSFCYYYVEELYGLLMENLPEGVEEVQIYNLYYSGGKMSQHHEWWLNDEANYQLFKTDKNGRNAVSSAATLEMALALENWDYISMHCASTELDVLNGEHAALCQQIKTSAEPLLDRMYSLFPNAQLLWQRTWFFEVGCIRNGHTYTAQDGPKYDASIWAVADYICNEFDQNKPYDVKMVNSGAAWTEARALNEVANLLPTGGLCARKGVANEETYQYVKDNPTATDVGDGYHDGDIGGGQLLNAYIWYMTLTGDADLSDNNYAPATDNLAGYSLEIPGHIQMLKDAAMNSFAAN